MKNITFKMPRKIEIGFSKSKELGKIIKQEKFRKVLIVVDYNLKKMGSVNWLFNHLDEENISFSIFDKIKNEPTISEIDQGINELKIADNYDGIIAIGGGSTIDLAKLFAVSSVMEGSVKNYLGTNTLEKRGIPTIVLPTTSGTGAEVTPNSIVKDTKKECKTAVVSPYLIPDLVILDPELTFSLPPKVTAETGIDAFTHAIECFTCNKSNPMSDLFALDSIRLISKYLRRAFRNGEDKEARYYMAIGSLYGGIAITNSGTGGVHALAYPLGGKYNFSHGLSNSILLSEVMAFNAKAVPKKFVKVAEAMGIEANTLSEDEILKSVLQEIKKLINDVGISIGEFEISEKILQNLATMAISEQQRLLRNNPRPIFYEDAYKIYKESLL